MNLKDYVISETNTITKKGTLYGIIKNKKYFVNWLIFTFLYRVQIA